MNRQVKLLRIYLIDWWENCQWRTHLKLFCVQYVICNQKRILELLLLGNKWHENIAGYLEAQQRYARLFWKGVCGPRAAAATCLSSIDFSDPCKLSHPQNLLLRQAVFGGWASGWVQIVHPCPKQGQGEWACWGKRGLAGRVLYSNLEQISETALIIHLSKQRQLSKFFLTQGCSWILVRSGRSSPPPELKIRTLTRIFFSPKLEIFKVEII